MSYCSSKKRPLYHQKREKGTVTVHHKVYNNENINNVDSYELVNICSSGSRYVVNPEWETTWNKNSSKCCHWFNCCMPRKNIDVMRFEKGSSIGFQYASTEKNPSFSTGASFKDIFEVNMETDGLTERKSEFNVKELDNDILVIKIKGGKSRFSNLLNCDIEYLEIERVLEQLIFKRQLNKDMEEFTKINKLVG